MGSQMNDRLLQRPLYVFDLPKELLYTLHLKSQETAPTTDTAPTPPATPAPSQESNGASVPATSCGLCDLTFKSLQDQRAHVRSDLHGYNLKQKLRGRQIVNETEFERLVGELDESISGSDSEESDDDSESDGTLDGSKGKDDTLRTLLKRQARINDGGADDAPDSVLKKKKNPGTAPILWLNSDKLPTNVSLGVYRAVFTDREQSDEAHLVETLQGKQLVPSTGTSASQRKQTETEEGGVRLPASMITKDQKVAGPHYFLCMIGGGHFAAMLVSLAPKYTKKSGVEDRSASVIAHKTFHRYTTRRKQGGSQSASDNSKGNAHSAGSSLRRYNEVALEADVRTLLADWKVWLESADMLFVRATGSTNRRTLFGPYDGQVLSQKDARLRGFPFSTRRATQSELMRAFVELTRVKVSTVDEAALARKAVEDQAQAERQRQQQANGKPSKTEKPPKPSKEEEEALLHTSQLQALVRRSKAPALVSYLQSNGLSPDFQFVPAEQNHHAPTSLHLASANNSAACVAALLVKAGADPGLRNEERKTAFDIAGERATRDAFRLARSQLGEQKWNWDEAGVPSPLSQADSERRAAREKEEKAAEDKAEKERRQAEAQRLRKEDEQKQANMRDKKFGKGNALGAATMTAEERRMEDARGMSDAMRMRLERERRARAAEERIRRMKGGG